MRKRIGFCAVGIALALASTASFAADLSDKKPHGISEPGGPIDEKADAIVVYTPMAHHALDKVVAVERTLSGRVGQHEKGVTEKQAGRPMVIVHTANTLIMPLEAGVPVRMYLKRFQDRDAYYPIAIYPLSHRSNNAE